MSCIPGRFGEEFIEKRREKLEIWINRISQHPVLSESAVFQHFLTCGDNEKVNHYLTSTKLPVWPLFPEKQYIKLSTVYFYEAKMKYNLVRLAGQWSHRLQ